ncbi:Putative protein ybiU [Fusarium odoratissimum]|uniref:DUF1479 domain protein n=1 Tax=Fusarium oxysporum f. sp. cubense (strain race 4) TaxID=2502994 RepID=N1RX54_FUSC4|nr:Putative protein ybiU [Fusarium odoratissimum]
MKFSILTALTAIVGSAAAANQAVVTNDCSGTIYVQSWPYNGGAPGPLVTLKPGQKFSENLRSTGSTVKIATTKTLTNPLFFGYSSTSKPNYVYYEFSTQWGNPFANKHNILTTGKGCKQFDCKAGDASCYSTPSMKKDKRVGEHTSGAEKAEGSIGNSFASLAGEKETLLPERYLDLKREIIGDKSNQDALTAAWARLTARLAELSDEIEEKQQRTIPEANYHELVENPSFELVQRIRQCGSVVIRKTVSQEQALRWLEDVWSKAQQQARSHSQMLKTQAALLSIFTAAPDCKVSLTSPLVYSDRLRIRNPGDAKFALGPHMDGGSIERWEDPTYRQVYEKILTGNWEEFDAWEMDKRADTVHDLYPGPGSTGLFRSWQGWTSLSEGTLLLYPFICERTSYMLMRPLFKPKKPKPEFQDRKAYLSPDNWELDFDTTNFPGSPHHRNQELNDETHPHLELPRTMVCMPKVYPGDSVWWHSDVIHAVESRHNGKNAAAVFYAPAVALTPKNMEYIRDQKATLLSGRPPPDFPGGTGESEFKSRGTGDDLLTVEGKEGQVLVTEASSVKKSADSGRIGLVPFKHTDTMSETERLTRQAA